MPEADWDGDDVLNGDALPASAASPVSGPAEAPEAGPGLALFPATAGQGCGGGEALAWCRGDALPEPGFC